MSNEQPPPNEAGTSETRLPLRGTTRKSTNPRTATHLKCSLAPRPLVTQISPTYFPSPITHQDFSQPHTYPIPWTREKKRASSRLRSFSLPFLDFFHPYYFSSNLVLLSSVTMREVISINGKELDCPSFGLPTRVVAHRIDVPVPFSCLEMLTRPS